MNNLQIYTLCGLALYFLTLITLGYRDSLRQDQEGFVIGNRNIGLLPTIGSVSAGYRDGSGVVFFIGASLTIGYAGFWYFAAVLISLLIFSQLACKIRAVAEQKQFITIGQIVRENTGPMTEKTASALTLIHSLFYIMIQLYVSGNLLSRLIDVPEYIGIFAIGAVVAAYLFFGGYGTVIRTDLIQFFVILSMAAIPFFIKPDMSEVLDFSSFILADPIMIFGLCILGFFTPMANADLWQRVFSAKDHRTIKLGFPLSGGFLVIMTMSLIVIGMGIKELFPDVGAGELVFALFHGGETSHYIPTFVLVFFAIGIMSVTMSTLDTMCYLFSSTLAKNFLPDRFHNTKARYLNFSRIVFVTIIALMCGISLLIDDIIEAIISVVTMVTILGPVYMLTAFGLVNTSKRIDAMISASIIISFGVYIALFIMGYMGDIFTSNIPTLISAALCGAIAVYARQQKPVSVA